jgi:ABC-type transport system substrate-binding protein
MQKDLDPTLVIRQYKDAPNEWYVAAQVNDPAKAAALAKQYGRKANDAFGVNSNGDVGGNKAVFTVVNKSVLKEATKIPGAIED